MNRTAAASLALAGIILTSTAGAQTCPPAGMSREHERLHGLRADHAKDLVAVGLSLVGGRHGAFHLLGDLIALGQRSVERRHDAGGRSEFSGYQ